MFVFAEQNFLWGSLCTSAHFQELAHRMIKKAPLSPKGCLLFVSKVLGGFLLERTCEVFFDRRVLQKVTNAERKALLKKVFLVHLLGLSIIVMYKGAYWKGC